MTTEQQALADMPIWLVRLWPSGQLLVLAVGCPQ